jgi:tyrosine-protein phosphatase OCA1
MSTVFYIPPLNFGIVDEGIYRSGLLNELNFPFIERLKLKSIVYLEPDEPDTHMYVDTIAPHISLYILPPSE